MLYNRQRRKWIDSMRDDSSALGLTLLEVMILAENIRT